MIKRKKYKKEHILKMWKGVDIINNGGFGITDFHSYINRDDFKKNLKQIKKSKLWNKLINSEK